MAGGGAGDFKIGGDLSPGDFSLGSLSFLDDELELEDDFDW